MRSHFITLFAARLLAILTLSLALSFVPARAQDSDDLTDADYAEMGEAGSIVREIRPLKNKTLVLIFDISGSMRAENMMRRARSAAIQIVKNGTSRGDDVVLITFGPGYETFKKHITGGADRKEIIDKIPVEPGTDAGTNIRKPHHDALKLLKEAEPRPGAIVVLTDSYNDQPKTDNPAYKGYLSYYVPGQLSKYPKTSDNAAYESLLNELIVSGKVKQYGVGVGFANSGRPIERLPQQAPPPAPVQRTETQETEATAPPPKTDYTWLWILLGVGVVAVAGFLVAPMFKPVTLRISGGPGGPKDFQISGGQTLRIGGDGANFAPDAYPLPGVTQIIATIKVAGGRMTLSPPIVASAPGKAPAAGAPPAANNANAGNEKNQPRVYHNGLPLETSVPLLHGDEIKVTVPQAGGVPKDYRLKLSDPRENG